MKLRPASECKWDLVSLGEVMLRLDPGDHRVRTARNFDVWEGGGEYNVARGLRRCFEMRTAVVTALVDNEVGRLLEDLMLRGGVDLSHIYWLPFDGVGHDARNPLNFTERGFGVRGARGCSDRAHSACSRLKPGDIDFRRIFQDEGVRVLHCGGIFCALSESAPDVAMEAMQAAREAGTLVSYDLNYRPSLWKARGGQEKAQEINRTIAPFVDIMIGNEEDFSACLGFEIEGIDENLTKLDPVKFKKMIQRVVKDYPHFQAVATTLRGAITATRNDWGAILYANGEFHEATKRPELEVFDRVGGGDSFASGLLYGFLSGKSPAEAVEYGAAHGALAMTTPGDTSMATFPEVQNLVKGGSARVVR